MRKKNVQRLIKRGRRVYGAIYKLRDGREVYLAWRKQEEMFRAGEKTRSDALALGKAAWTIDDETLTELRLQGVNLIGIYVKESADIYLTTLDHFLDAKLAKPMNYEVRGGALQRYLSVEHFGHKMGSTTIR